MFPSHYGALWTVTKALPVRSFPRWYTKNWRPSVIRLLILQLDSLSSCIFEANSAGPSGVSSRYLTKYNCLLRHEITQKRRVDDRLCRHRFAKGLLTLVVVALRLAGFQKKNCFASLSDTMSANWSMSQHRAIFVVMFCARLH